MKSRKAIRFLFLWRTFAQGETNWDVLAYGKDNQVLFEAIAKLNNEAKAGFQIISPMPGDSVGKVFSVLHTAARYSGE
ncbi:MAG: hypothetical protein H7A33_07580 [Deltaproteobacteria bacterium]|nr:hypothetical protein [Deltaproteobacteria bacterium]